MAFSKTMNSCKTLMIDRLKILFIVLRVFYFEFGTLPLIETKSNCQVFANLRTFVQYLTDLMHAFGILCRLRYLKQPLPILKVQHFAVISAAIANRGTIASGMAAQCLARRRHRRYRCVTV